MPPFTPERGRKEASMTPQERIKQAVENMPANLKGQYQADLKKTLALFEEIDTDLNGRTDQAARTSEEHNRLVSSRARLMSLYLKQGGMTEHELRTIDRKNSGWGLLRELQEYYKKKEA